MAHSWDLIHPRRFWKSLTITHSIRGTKTSANPADSLKAELGRFRWMLGAWYGFGIEVQS